MRSAIKRQLKVWYSDIGLALLVVLGCGVLGKIIFQIVVCVDKEVTKTAPIAAMFAMIGAGMFCAILGLVQLPISFRTEVSLNCTRKHFLGSFYAVQMVLCFCCYLVVLLIGAAERALDQIWYSGWEREFELMPFLSKWGLLILITLAMASCFGGVLIMHFGRTAFWCIWCVWMILAIGGPQISEAMEETPDSMFGRIGTWIANLLGQVPMNLWALLGLLVIVGSAAGTWGFLRREQVTI